MARVSKVLVVLLALAFAGVSFAAMSPEKAAYIESVDQAKALYAAGAELTPEQTRLLKDEGVIREARNELDTFAGPDQYGYTFTDSNEPNGPVYEWVDISETGTLIDGWIDDTNLGPFDVGFDFSFYGEDYSQFWLCSNGWLTFSDAMQQEYNNTDLPDVDLPNNAIYYCWEDWRPDGNDAAWYGLDEDGNCVIQFGWAHDDFTGVNDSEIILYTDGRIKLQFGPNFVVRDEQVTIGLENLDGTDGFSAFFNDNIGYPAPEVAIMFEILDMGEIAGEISDATTNEPIPGAEVFLYQDGTLLRTTTTDDLGLYNFRVEIGDYDVAATAFTYDESDMNACTVLVEQTVTVDIALEQLPAPEITVNTNDLEFTAPWMGTDTQTLTVTNSGNSDLEFSMSIEYVPEEEEQLFHFRNHIRQIRENMVINHQVAGNTIYTGPESTDPSIWGRERTPARYSELDDPYFLIFEDSAPWFENESHQDALNEFEIPFDVVGSAMMADQDLGDYTVIMTPSCQPQAFYDTFQANEDRFAEFVDHGGWLEFHGCTQGANWTLWDNSSYVHESSQENIVVEPDHPICANIDPRFTGSSANHGWISNVPEESIILITDPSDRPTVIESFWGQGRMIVSTETFEFAVQANPPQQAGTVMRNAILYTAENAGGGWLSFEPDAGTIAPGVDANLLGTADASMGELNPGVYEAVITIEANFPNVESVDVWATLTVLDPGSIDGHVYDNESMEALPNAMVYRYDANDEIVQEIICDEFGYYSFPVGEGTHTLVADIDGYYPSEGQDVDVVQGAVTTQDFYLDAEIPAEIYIDPAIVESGLFFELDWGYPDVITMDLGNIGGLPLNWQAFVEFLEPEAEMNMDFRNRVRENYRNNIFRSNNQRNLGGLTIDYATYPSTPSNQRYSELDDPYFLLVQDSNPWGYTSNQEVLTELEIPFDLISSATLANTDFGDYTVIMCAGLQDANFYSNLQANYEPIVDFIEGGGWFQFCGSQGSPWTLWDGTHSQTGNYDNNNILVPDHPMLIDMPSPIVGNAANHGSIAGFPEDAVVLVEDDGGSATIVEYRLGRGNVLLSTQTWEYYWANGAGDNHPGLVLRRACAYSALGATGGGWLTIEPDEGVLDVDGTQELTLTADAVPEMLEDGTYEAIIEIADDDIRVEPVQFWATLVVHGGPPQYQVIGGVEDEEHQLNTNYFELISTYIDPVRFETDAADIFSIIPGLAVAYENNGDVYIPEIANDIADIDYTQGYRIFLREVEEPELQFFSIRGDFIDPETTEYHLQPNIWNWIGYPFRYEVPVEAAFAEVVDNIRIVLNDEGEFYIPGLINTMGMMTPGEGYMVISTVEMDFTYAMPVPARVRADMANVWNIPEVEDPAVATGLPYPVLVNLTENLKSCQPATIEIYDGNLLVGKAIVIDDKDLTPVVTWEGSASHDVEGFVTGNQMSFVVKNASGSIIPVTIEDSPAFGEGAFANVTLDGNALPTEFTVRQGYPNPFNPSVTIPFALPASGEVSFKVFNVLGQEVMNMNRHYEVGNHKFMFNAGNSLVSGVYFMQVEFNNQIHTQKLMLLK